MKRILTEAVSWSLGRRPLEFKQAVPRGTCSNAREASELLAWQPFGGPGACSLTLTALAFLIGVTARAQEAPHPAQSVVEAARNVREQKSNSTKHPKIITNDELGGPSVPSASASLAESSSTNKAEAPKPSAGDCDNPEAQRLRMDLLAVQGEREQIRRELAPPSSVPDSHLDLRNFKPGKSGFDAGGPALLEAKPPVPARVAEADLEEKIASLNRALRIACDSPEDAGIQMKLDKAEQELNLSQRQLDLDQAAYYSKTSYAADAAGKARLDGEVQQVQNLQSEIARLKEELAASKANPLSK
jgi:hypothetical protein